MAYQDGFTYIQGPFEYRQSVISVGETFKRGDPVTLSDDRTVIEAASDTSNIFGFAMSNAADSIGGPVLNTIQEIGIPTAQTVFAVKVTGGVAASALSAGEALSFASASGRIGFVGARSAGSEHVVIVPRADGSTIDSADSSVYVQVIGNVLGVFGSNTSVTGWAQN